MYEMYGRHVINLDTILLHFFNCIPLNVEVDYMSKQNFKLYRQFRKAGLRREDSYV